MQTPPTTVPHPFAGSKDDEVPNKFDLARIEGARLAQLKMNAPSTVRGVQMSPLVSAEDVYAAELKHGTIPVVLQKPGIGSKPKRILRLKAGGTAFEKLM